jgi:hypothetical protein
MAGNPLDENDPVRQQRIREEAYRLWEADGRPSGRDLEYWERARELVGMMESAGAGQLPNPETHPTMVNGLPEGVEEAEIQENYGEFPDRFADQGEWQQTPTAKNSRRTRKKSAAATQRRGPPKPAGST